MRGKSTSWPVDEYLDALESHDYERARGFLADEGFSYESPISSFSSADDFMQHMSLLGGIVQKIERLKVFVDGRDVCHILVFVTQLSDKASTKVVQWARVEDGRIRRIQSFYDTHWYREMFSEGDEG
jgi:hypothetical protein